MTAKTCTNAIDTAINWPKSKIPLARVMATLPISFGFLTAKSYPRSSSPAPRNRQ
jgi:hypothetical protein